jgi:hypothetical protein
MSRKGGIQAIYTVTGLNFEATKGVITCRQVKLTYRSGSFGYQDQFKHN